MASISSSSSSTPSKRTPRRPKVSRSPITSEAEREQTLRNYKVTIEYKHLKQHAPSGVYVIPSLDDLRTFHGVIFLRRGLYANGIFKFQINLPNEYNHLNSWPQIVFTSHVYNPHVNPETGELDVRTPYPEWNPQRHYLVTVLTYLKKIFYMKTSSSTSSSSSNTNSSSVKGNGYENAIANLEAKELSKSNPALYRKKVESCVRESGRSVFVNDPGCTVKFVEENACHEILRQIMKDTFYKSGSTTSTTTSNNSTSKNGSSSSSKDKIGSSDDISSRVTRGKVLGCIKEAQIAAKKIQEEEEAANDVVGDTMTEDGGVEVVAKGV